MLLRQCRVERLTHGHAFPRGEELRSHDGITGEFRACAQCLQKWNACLVQQPAMRELLQCHQDIVGQAATLRASTATTDVRFFHLYGNIPSTCYGPQGANIHGVDEWVSLTSLEEVTAVLALFIARWCGLNRLKV